LSARALAIDTGLAKPEEFPVFKEFWLEKPKAGATSLTFYGLLDSPSVAGAYRFVLHPGADLTFEVSNHLYFRQAVERVGIAPITSMFLVGKNKEAFIDDYRPEVHDSDGLLVKKSPDEYLWRPLTNFKQLNLSIFKQPTLNGFGLLQRERDAKQYQDFLGFERRPSLWVEPLGHWAPGAVYLIEIPTDAERYDNIGAFWVPDETARAGKEYTFQYRLHFLLTNPSGDNLAKVVGTHIGAGEPVSTDHHKRRFVIDFQGGSLSTLTAKEHLLPVVASSAGSIEHIQLQPSPDKKFWRLMFELEPENNVGPIELQATLKNGAKNVTETWLYQWHRVN
jgi:glucans biosynthesis protein